MQDLKKERDLLALKNFFGNYLYEDWKAEFSVWQDALFLYLQKSTRPEITDLREDVATLLSSLVNFADVDQLSKELLVETGLYYMPGENISDYQTWLEEVIHRVDLLLSGQVV